MAVPPIVIKAIATAATDKRTWEFVVMLIAAVLMPVILCVMSVAILVTGAESSSVSLLEYSFNSEELPSGVSEEQRQAVENMRLWLGELDEEITEYSDSDSLDVNLVKAVFYCVNIGGEAVVTQPYADFLSCFEDRTAEDLREVLEDISEQFPEITITENQLSGIRKVYDFLNEMEVSDEEIEIKSGEPGQESLYYSDCNPDVRGAYIGHLRMDFGDGNEFWSTWWENNSDLKTEQFRSELDGVRNGLRSSGLLKNRRAMMSYCSRHTNLNLGRSYGFKAETENYIFLLRCQPGEGYDCYCYCYDKRELQQIQLQEQSSEPGMNLSL